MPAEHRAPETCAQCGERLAPSARACPECGADERTGWREASPHDGLDLPDSAWDEDPASGAAPPPARVNGLAWYWWTAGLVLLAALALATPGAGRGR